MKKRVYRMFSFIFIMGVLSIGLYAGGYPIAINNYVNDFANVLDENSRKVLSEKLKAVEMKNNTEITVVTVNSINDFNTGETTIEGFAKGLFNYWGVGSRWENRGVMILVAVADRKCRIEVGAGYGKSKNEIMQKIIDEKMVPSFKDGAYTTGIIEGVNEVVYDVTSKFAFIKHYKGNAFIWIITALILWSIASMALGRGSGIFGIVSFLLDMIPSGYNRNNDNDSDRPSSNSFGGGRSSGGGASGSW